MKIEPKMVNIASTIKYYLEKNPDFYEPSCYAAGRFIKIKYMGYWDFHSLTKTEALRYLDWLTAGNVGTHWQLRIASR